jgi:hypothetical protein
MRFVIIAARRTGSSHLVNTLSGHAEIFCHGNVFAPKMMAVFWPKEGRISADNAQALKSELRKLRKTDPEAFLDRIFATSYGRPHVGFKIFRGQNDEMLEKIIADSSIRKVVLFRRNLLASHSSDLAARDTGKWGVRAGQEQLETPKVLFAREGFAKYVTRHLEYYNSVLELLLRARQTFHFMEYEDINEPVLLRSLVNFIGADPGKPIIEDQQRKRQAKQNSSNIISRFSNGNEVQEFLSARNLSSWMQEGETMISDHSFLNEVPNLGDGSSAVSIQNSVEA